MNCKKPIIFSIILFLLTINSYAQSNLDSTVMLYPNNIITITFNNNNQIKSAYYNLESAKSNFKLFERGYSQFNPLIVAPKMHANSNGEYSAVTTVGLEKEFFNGSSISATVGSDNDFGKNIRPGSVNFVETEVGFPLFSSSRALERMIKRTFEENELYTKNLDYVDAVKNNIHHSLEQYYDLVPRIKIYNMLKEQRNELVNLVSVEKTDMPASEKEQIQGEITNLNSDITGWEISMFRTQLDMKRILNVTRLNLDQIKTIDVDFSQPDYFGEYYIKASTDTIFQKALENDTEFKVLGVIKKNAEEKKRLAEEGKWDIYATTGAHYNFYEATNGQVKNNFFAANAGLNLKLNDKKILKETIAKAQADIDAIAFTILDRKNSIKSDILQLKDALIKKKAQLINTAASLSSWEKTYASKKQQYLANQESVDNLIQAFRSLLETKETFFHLENNYFDTIRDFDFVSGEYFSIINISNTSN